MPFRQKEGPLLSSIHQNPHSLIMCSSSSSLSQFLPEFLSSVRKNRNKSDFSSLPFPFSQRHSYSSAFEKQPHSVYSTGYISSRNAKTVQFIAQVLATLRSPSILASLQGFLYHGRVHMKFIWCMLVPLTFSGKILELC